MAIGVSAEFLSRLDLFLVFSSAPVKPVTLWTVNGLTGVARPGRLA
jgi:hypothetical protein